MEYKYRVYGKKLSKTQGKDGKYRPFDMQRNVFVNKLFYASMFTTDLFEKLQKEVAAMNRMNPEYNFEIRTI